MDMIGLRGPMQARDLWRQQDLGEFADGYTVRLPEHGVRLLKIARRARSVRPLEDAPMIRQIRVRLGCLLAR